MSSEDIYDIVIVGGGSSGCVIARRVAEALPSKTVLLVEAGAHSKAASADPVIRDPTYYGAALKGQYDWNFRTTKQAGAKDREMVWPRGKILGGSSGINATVWMRPNKHNLQTWADLGCANWAPEHTWPYFDKIELGAREAKVPSVAGIRVLDCFPDKISQVTHCFISAATEAGIPYFKHYNELQKESVAYMQVNHFFDNSRCSAADGYLDESALKKLPNLIIRCDTTVTKVKMDGKKAVGVLCRSKDGLNFAVCARNEVVICAGAVQSPQTLLLSGIGPKKALEKFSIPVVAELPGVGKNLQDHVWAPCVILTKEPVIMQQNCSVVEGNMYLNGKCVKNSLPNLQVMLGNFAYSETYKDFQPSDGLTLAPTLLYPKSRGEITLNSSDPLDPPRIDANYFNHEDDLPLLVEGLQRVRELGRSSAFSSSFKEEIAPGKAIQTKEQLEDYVRANSVTMYHPVGTCKMGPDEDKMAVVDPVTLKVKGVENLRVGDCSIMPTLGTVTLFHAASKPM